MEATSNRPVKGINVFTKDNSSTEDKQTKYSSSKNIDQNVQKEMEASEEIPTIAGFFKRA